MCSFWVLIFIIFFGWSFSFYSSKKPHSTSLLIYWRKKIPPKFDLEYLFRDSNVISKFSSFLYSVFQWSDCNCAQNGETVIKGIVHPSCDILFGYLALMYFGLFAGNLFFMVNMMIILRSVYDDQVRFYKFILWLTERFIMFCQFPNISLIFSAFFIQNYHPSTWNQVWNLSPIRH